jgi:succinate dehydrogenase/fumarate reductase-like Fe-S protein
MSARTFRVWRGDADGGDFAEFDVEVNEGEVILDVVHRLQAEQRRTWPCGGTARRASAARARPR